MTISINPASQQAPAHFLNRVFAMQHNLPKLGALADSTRKFPSMGRENALAMVALAAVRLEVALAGQAQANNTQNAGSVAGWAAEVTAARADVNDALAAVKAAFPAFATAADVNAALIAKAQVDIGKTAYAHPAGLSATWFTGNVAPTVNNIVSTVANNTAISVNFLTASSSSDADSNVRRVKSINGKPINYAANSATTQTFVVDGKTFTFTKATQVLSATAQTAVKTWTGTFVIEDDEGGVAPERTWSIQNLA